MVFIILEHRYVTFLECSTGVDRQEPISRLKNGYYLTQTTNNTLTDEEETKKGTQ